MKDAAPATVLDANASLSALARRRLSGRPDSAMVLSRHAESPHTWQAPLTAELTAAGAAGDDALVAAATAVLRLADEPGFLAGKYAVDRRAAATPAGTGPAGTGPAGTGQATAVQAAAIPAPAGDPGAQPGAGNGQWRPDRPLGT